MAQAHEEPHTMGEPAPAAVRVSGEVGGAVAGSTAGAACGLGIWALSRNDCEALFGNFDTFVVSWGVGTLVGLALVPVLVNEIGDALDGSGGAGWSLLGELIGLLSSALVFWAVPLAAGVDDPPDTLFALSFGGVGIGTMAGAIIGYEMSSPGE